MRHIRDPKRPLGDTPSPAGFPLGSRRSRASARAKMEARGLPPSPVLVFCGHPDKLCKCHQCVEYMRLVHLDARKPRAIPILILVGVDAQGHCVDWAKRAPSSSSTSLATGCSETFLDGTTVKAGVGELWTSYWARLQDERARQQRKGG